MRRRVDGYRCEALASCPELARQWRLGSHQARSPRLAIRWLRWQAGKLAHGLAPDYPPPAPAERPRAPNSGEGGDPGQVFLDWLDDITTQERQLDALAKGLDISVGASSGDRICGGAWVNVFYLLGARPLTSRRTTGWDAPAPPPYLPA